MGILLSHKVDFRAKKSGRDKEENYVMIKGSIHHDDIILNGAPNKRTSKYIKQNLIVLKEKMDKSTIMVSDFTFLSQ